MSIASAITAAQGKVANAYTAVSGKGGTLPATQNLSNLPTAINSIPSGSVEVKKVEQSGGTLWFNCLFSGTSYGSSPGNALNSSSDITITSGTYTIWGCARSGTYSYTWKLVATINL